MVCPCCLYDIDILPSSGKRGGVFAILNEARLGQHQPIPLTKHAQSSIHRIAKQARNLKAEALTPTTVGKTNFAARKHTATVHACMTANIIQPCQGVSHLPPWLFYSSNPFSKRSECHLPPSLWATVQVCCERLVADLVDTPSVVHGSCLFTGEEHHLLRTASEQLAAVPGFLRGAFWQSPALQLPQHLNAACAACFRWTASVPRIQDIQAPLEYAATLSAGHQILGFKGSVLNCVLGLPCRHNAAERKRDLNPAEIPRNSTTADMGFNNEMSHLRGGAFGTRIC